MVDVNHYDENGKKIGSSSGGSGGGDFVLILFGAFIYGIYAFFDWGIEQVTNWQSLDLPYSYIGAFYYYVILEPINIGINIVNWIGTQELTRYPNLNIILTILGALAYIVFVFFIIRTLIKILRRFDSDATALFWFILTMPALLAGAWFIILSLFNWLTSTV